MARTTKPLTDTQIKQAKPREREYSLADGGGLTLRVKPSGSKLWLLNYTRPYKNRRTNIGLGLYPEVSLAYARRKRDEARELLAQGVDPKEFRDQQNQNLVEAHVNTLESVAGQWFEVKRTQVSADYAQDIWRSLELHVFSALGKYPLHSLKAVAVINELRPLAAKGSLETVKRVCQRLNEIMTYAVNTGIVDANPLASISSAFQSPIKKHMATIRPEELPWLMQALMTASIKLPTRCLIEWQLHTMVRPGEAAQARWDEIDAEASIWHAPSETMKKKRAHKIPLTPQSLALLEVMRPISGHREFIFPGDRNPRSHISKQTANMALKRMGFGGQLVAHGLRSIASTALNEQGFDPDVIESALAHKDKNEVRAAYNRAEYLERRRVVMGWWSDYIERAATGNVSLSGQYRALSLVST